MDKFVSRVDLFGTTLWTPPFSSPAKADLLAAMVQEAAMDHDCADFRALAAALDVMGARLILKPDHHGTRHTWTILLREDGLLLRKVRDAVNAAS